MSSSFQIWGLQSKVGTTVTANIAGLDCGTYLVAADGSITVPYQSDPDQALTPDYLHAISLAAPAQGWGPTATIFDVVLPGSPTIYTRVTVPCSVGYPYISQGQRLRPDQQNEAKTQSGPALGEKRRVYQFASLIAAGVRDDLAFGANLNTLTTAVFYNGTTPLDHKTVFTGVHWSTINDTYSFDGMVCWQTQAPQPLIIASIGGFIETNER